MQGNWIFARVASSSGYEAWGKLLQAYFHRRWASPTSAFGIDAGWRTINSKAVGRLMFQMRIIGISKINSYCEFKNHQKKTGVWGRKWESAQHQRYFESRDLRTNASDAKVWLSVVRWERQDWEEVQCNLAKRILDIRILL
jgi:hypothetical protein